ncbi:MAG: TetR/AcrR family transcriptional regulator [Acidimicrobiia bacterium]
MTSTPPPGRPRDESVDRRVIDATMSLLADEGPSSLTIESIALRAGVSKSSIYRRWSSKDEIIVAAIGTIAAQVTVAATGNLRADLVRALDGLRSLVSDSRAGELLPWLAAEMAKRSEIGLLYFRTVVGPRRAAIGQLVESARSRGEVRTDIDTDTVVDLLTGPVIIRKMTGRLDAAPDDWSTTIVDELLRGLTP